jgi:predicted phage terminase large subunit-like protein
MTVWGAFEHPEERRPKLMLRDAWQERLNLQQLIRLVIKTCRDHKVDTLLIEDSARGGDVRDEIGRQLGRRDIRVILLPVDTSKVARLQACVPVFYSGVIYAPERDWSDMVIRQVAAFPRGHHDDLTDTVSLAVNYLRGTGVAVRAPEYDEDLIEARRFRKKPTAVYDV